MVCLGADEGKKKKKREGGRTDTISLKYLSTFFGIWSGCREDELVQ